MNFNNKKPNKIKSSKKNNYTPVSKIADAYLDEHKDSGENTEECSNSNTCDDLIETKPLYSVGKTNDLKIDFSVENLQRAFIYSEIISKPKCKRRGRWR